MTSPSTTASHRFPPREHLVQVYAHDPFLAEVVSEFLGAGLRQSDGALVIATPAHIEAFTAQLAFAGIDVAGAIAEERLLVLDAVRTLAQFLTDGVPDRAAFLGIMAAGLDRVRASGAARIRCFGEMVDLLWARNLPATLALEELWNVVLADERLSLLCAYRLDPFERSTRGILHQVSWCHSHLLPEENPQRFRTAVERAYEDVFGVAGDATMLRGLISNASSRGPVMTTDQAALLALHDVSDDLAEQVLERGRHHYVRLDR